MTLYRATLSALPGGTVRHLSFAARSDTDALRTAQAWACGRRVLVVKPVRPLVPEPQQLVLTP